jgi:hypothetical protein
MLRVQLIHIIKKCHNKLILLIILDHIAEGFDYSQPTNWSPGQPAPEGYKVVNMMGDTFLEKKYPSKQEMSMMPGLMPMWFRNGTPYR